MLRWKTRYHVPVFRKPLDGVLGDQEPCAVDRGCKSCTVEYVVFSTLIYVSRAKTLLGTSPNVELSLKGSPKLLSRI